MRERMDFSSISKIILENRGIDGFSQTDYYCILFSYAFEQTDIMINMPEDADISKILSGQRNVVKDIIYLYQTSESIYFLEKSVELLLKQLTDPFYVMEQIYRLLWNDNTISQIKKQELSRRYNLACEFITDCLIFALSRTFISRGKKNMLTEAKKFAVSDYLLDYHFPSANRIFYGREQELIEIHELLMREHCLFLEGIGGIGKSELAKQYVKHYGKEYTHVIYLRYSESLKRTIAQLDFVDDMMEMEEEERFHSHYRFFKYLGDSSLVVLDNFNEIPEEETLFHDFLSLSFQVLVTTRSHIEEVPSYLVQEIQNIGDLCSIFKAYAGIEDNHIETTKEIIEEVYRHTLTVELSAKTLTASGIEPKQLLLALKEEGLKLSNPNKVVLKKDSFSQKDRLYQHIQTLFQLQGLSAEHFHTLQNMSLMPDKGISKVLFHHWQGKQDYNSVNELIEYGWIGEDTTNHRLYLHPYLHKIMTLETAPSIIKCGDLLKGIFENCVCYGIDVPYYNELLNAIESIYKNISLDDTVSASLFMDSTMSYLAKYGRIESMEKVLQLMKELFPLNKEHKRQSTIYCCYAGYAEYMKSNYFASKIHYEQGLEILEPIHPVYAELASNLHNNLAQTYLALKNHKEFLYHIKIAMELRKEYSLPFSHDTLVQGISYAQALAISGECNEARKQMFFLIREIKKISGMNMTLYEMYYALACIENKYFPTDSLSHFKKAREALLNAYLPQDSQKVKEIEDKIKRTEQYLYSLEYKSAYRIPRIIKK